MNKEELISLKRKSKELKEARKELEVYRVALKLVCNDFGYSTKNARILRDTYIKVAQRKLNNE